METTHITVTNVPSNQSQHGKLVFDSRELGKLTYDNGELGKLMYGDPNCVAPGLTGVSIIGEPWIGDFPPWELPYYPSTAPPLFPWTPAPWIPDVQTANNYIYIDPRPSPWHVTTAYDRITLVLDVPGVKPEDLNVQVEAGMLKVTGKRFDNGFAVLESWPIGSDYDMTTASAVLELGTLKLVFMKLASKQAHKVPVTVK